MIPVHFAGQPADMDDLMTIAGEKELIVIEDCAHAHGASWRGKSVGSIGDFGSFSFQASKNLTAGEGGVRDVAGAGCCFDSTRRFEGGSAINSGCLQLGARKEANTRASRAENSRGEALRQTRRVYKLTRQPGTRSVVSLY